MSVPLGMPTSFSPVKSLPIFVDRVSTTGDSAVTVTAVSSVAIGSCASTASVFDNVSWMLPA